jgi:hypothetical protein
MVRGDLMAIFAIIDGGLVLNTIDAADQETADLHTALYSVTAIARDISSESPRPAPGWSYDGEIFAAPIPAQVVRWINAADFLSRFSDAELGELQAIADSNSAVRGWVWWLNHQVAIDLDDTRISSRLADAVAAGKLTQARMDEILS